MVKIWRVKFQNYSTHDVTARTAKDAIAKAEKEFLKDAADDRKEWIESGKSVKDAPSPPEKLLRDEPISSVELIVEVP